MDRPLYAVLMAGGSGTRFWPASRRARPKQFLAIAGGETMLAATRARLDGVVPDERVIVVAAEEHAALVREALPALPPENLLLEPVGRNTLPCVALANAEVRRRDPDAVQAVLPADHAIEPVSAFRRSLSAAARAAAEGGGLLTFGVRPTRPATGYGYIELGPRLADVDGQAIHAVARFVEKPDLARAEQFVASGRFLWNSGIFVWTTEAVTEALERYAPRIWEALRDADRAGIAAAYAALEPLAVDVGVMERAERRSVLPIDYAWSDVGSWAALPEVLPADAAGNCVAGGGILEALDARRNVVFGPGGHVTALVGVADLVVVHSEGATLVCSRERAEEVREIVSRLSDRAPEAI